MLVPNLIEAKGPEDNWTGLKDAKQRKKLQNRLNVRAHRKRKAGLATAATYSIEGGLAAIAPTPSILLKPLCKAHLHCPTAAKPSEPSRSPCQCLVRIGIPGPLFKYISSLARRAKAQYHHYQPHQDSTRLSGLMFPLSRDHLLPLVQYNIMRAAVTNMTILAIDCHSDMCSVFWSSLTLFSAPETMPDTLAPTPLQLATPHQRWRDLLPHPRMRDNAILAEGHFDPAELEEDLFGEVCNEEAGLPCGDAAEMRGLLVWTDPWRPEGWEVTEGFVRKWGFLLKGCDAIFCASNRWRASRGEMPLVVKMSKD